MMGSWRSYAPPVGLSIALLVIGCGGPWRDGYFKKGVNRVTQEEVAEKMGPPHTAKTPALGGDTVWTYRVPVAEKELSSLHFAGLSNATKEATSLLGKPGEGPKETLYCYRYILTFNEQKVLKQWKREECVPGTREALQQND